MELYAHTQNGNGDPHLLRDHLMAVSKLAEEFARQFAPEEARLAGLLHDVGKYGDLFQARLEGRERRIDHWSAGAWLALAHCRALAAGAAIHAHHIGLQQLDKESLKRFDPERFAAHHPLGLRLSEQSLTVLGDRLSSDGLSTGIPPSLLYERLQETASAMIDVRMLYSALVDADFLDTEAHFQARPGEKKTYRAQGPNLQAARALSLLLAHVDGVATRSTAADEINRLRQDLFQACLNGQGQGLWTLSAPTGAGKTLAMLAFALQHAVQHGLSRIVVVIPYLSIIEQTAATYRSIFRPHFGDEYVLEDHSLAGIHTRENGSTEYDQLGGKAKLLAENWDAPVVVTTSVQMLESLFSNRPSACRKLHRLAESVILFDEVQTLPPNLAVSTLATLAHVAERYRTTVVFATATQPAFGVLDKSVEEMRGSSPGWKPEEVVPESLNLFDRAARTRIVWPDDLDARVTWRTVAEQIAETEQALCIVNLKRHAHELMNELRDLGCERVLHLSTAMCPAHRTRVLTVVKRLLDREKACKLVSTQCVEAGVDIDFPCLLRAFADLVSVAQAAGRCNRNARACMRDVIVFVPEDEAYPCGGFYRQAAMITKTLLGEIGPDRMDINDPKVYELYYDRLYRVVRPQEAAKAKNLAEAIVRQDFVEVARLYRLIEKDTINILVPYDKEAFAALEKEADADGLTADWIQRARPHTVSLFRPRDGAPILQRLKNVRVGRNEYANDWFIYLDPNDYTSYGLIPPDSDALWVT